VTAAVFAILLDPGASPYVNAPYASGDSALAWFAEDEALAAVKAAFSRLLNRLQVSIDVLALAAILQEKEVAYQGGRTFLPKLYCLVTKAAASALVAVHRSNIAARGNAAPPAVVSGVLLKTALSYLPSRSAPSRSLCHMTLFYAALATGSVKSVLDSASANPCELPPELIDLQEAYDVYNSTISNHRAQLINSLGGRLFVDEISSVGRLLAKHAHSYRSEALTIAQLDAVDGDLKWRQFVQ
jgi:hypothetical protein